jgi:hypothetical protein
MGIRPYIDDDLAAGRPPDEGSGLARCLSDNFRLQALTAVAPGLLPSWTAISSIGSLPAKLFSLATSSAVHSRLGSGIRNSPYKTA